MSKKMVSLLLALTMCMGLAVPAYAEPAEELPIPEETEVLQDEATMPEETESIQAVNSTVLPDPVQEDGPKLTDETGEELSDSIEDYLPVWITEVAACWEESCSSASVLSADGEVNSVSDGHAHLLEIVNQKSYWETKASGHRWVTETQVKCTVEGCGSKATLYDYYPQSGNFESHSMQRRYTGNNYHQGTKHYFEYEQTCAQCGYTTTLYESSYCPGPTGGGCIMPDTPINKLEPPVEELDMTETEDVTAPEETTEPEDVAEPEEVTEPEESAIPEETGIPEEVNAPEVTDIPEEVETPAETVEPEEIIAPEEPVIPEDTTGTGETVASDDGESVE